MPWRQNCNGPLSFLIRGSHFRIAAFAAMLAMASPAPAQIGPDTFLVGVGATSGSGSAEMTAFGPGFGDLLITDMISLREGEARFRDCDMALLEWRKRAEALKELDLQQSGAVDPDSMTINAAPPEPTALIEGGLTVAGDSISWVVDMRDRATGQALARSEGSVPADHVWEISERVARDMLEAACPRKGFAVRAQIDDLVIDTAVCDYSGPFEIVSLPGGASATISFAPTSAKAGSYTYAGQVAGAPASGAGTYVIELNPDGIGTLVIDGVFSVTSPMGTFSASGPETMALSPPGNACG